MATAANDEPGKPGDEEPQIGPLAKILTRGIQRRDFNLDEVRVIRAEGEPTHIQGHGAVFDKLSLPIGWGGFREEIKPGAFRKTIRENDVRSLFNHSPMFVIGRTSAKTLTLREDETGLFFDAIVPATTWAEDLTQSIERGDIDGGSFGFDTIKDKWRTEGGEGMGETIRTLIEVRLHDVGPVTFPAYPQTEVGVRSIVEAVGLDWTAIAGSFIQADRGLPLTSEQREIIETTIEALRHLLPAEPGQEPHSDDGNGSRARTRQGLRAMELMLLRA